MKKTYKLENLDCAHCAEKMQERIAKMDGIDNVSINFVLQKITLEGEDIHSLLPKIQKEINVVEEDCKIVY